MAKARLVIRDEILERVERLCEVTKAASPTELMAILVSRYGTHLEQTWEVLPVRNAQYNAMPEPQPDADFTFDEPLTGL